MRPSGGVRAENIVPGIGERPSGDVRAENVVPGIGET